MTGNIEQSYPSAGTSPYGKSSLVPDGHAWLRSAVSVIPYVGGALDHLLFDKADAIRLQNIESALREIGRKLDHLESEKIDREWFASDEALAVFRELVERIQFEPDQLKTRTLAQVVVASGTKDLSNDRHKLSMLSLLSRLSYVQMKLLKIISQVTPTRRTAPGKGASLSVTAIFSDDIMTAVENNPEGKFWHGNLDLSLELDLLEAVTFLRRITWWGKEAPYVVTRLGAKAVEYLNRTDT